MNFVIHYTFLDVMLCTQHLNGTIQVVRLYGYHYKTISMGVCKKDVTPVHQQ